MPLTREDLRAMGHVSAKNIMDGSSTPSQVVTILAGMSALTNWQLAYLVLVIASFLTDESEVEFRKAAGAIAA